MASLRIASTNGKQTGTVAMTTETTSISTSITSVDLTKSILLWSYQGATASPSESSFRAYLSSSTQITFERNADDASNNNVDFRWTVIQFATGATVQRFQFNDVDDGDTQSITAIDTATSFLILGGMRKGGSTYSADDECRVFFASTTSVEMRQGGTGTSDMDIAVQVVDIDDADVQVVSSSATSTTALTIDTSITSTVIADTMIFGSKENSTGTGFENLWWAAHLTSTTNLRLERDSGGSTSWEWTVYVVEVADATVQTVEVEMDNSTTERDFDVTAVADTELSFVNGLGIANGWNCAACCVISSGSEQDWNRVICTLTLIDADTVRVDRDASSSSTVSMFLQVIEVPEDTGSTVNGAHSYAGAGSMSAALRARPPVSFGGAGSLGIAVRLRPDVSFAGAGSLDAAMKVRPELSFAGAGTLDLEPEIEVDCYDEANDDSGLQLNTAAFDQIGQSFQGNGGNLTRATLRLQRVASATGTLTCELFAHTGTYGSSGTPTGTALATATTTYDASTISTSATNYDFLFDGTFEMVSGTPYFIVISGVTSGGANYIVVRADQSSPSAPGAAAYDDGINWLGDADIDLIFCVFSAPTETITISPTFGGAGSLGIDLKLRPTIAFTGAGSAAAALRVAPSISFSGSGSASAAMRVRPEIAFVGDGSLLVTVSGITSDIVSAIANEIEEPVAKLMTLEDYMALIDIWNTALAQLGIGTLDSTNDTSSQAVLLTRTWPLYKQAFLEEHAWNGAKTTAILSTFKEADGTTAVTPPGERWSYAFSTPSDFVRELRLNGLENHPGPKHFTGKGLWEVEIVTNAAGTKERCILTDESEARLEYIFAISDANISKLSPLNQHAMALGLAAYLASSFGASPAKKAQLEQLAMEAAAKARRADSVTGSRAVPKDTSILRSRMTRG